MRDLSATQAAMSVPSSGTCEVFTVGEEKLLLYQGRSNGWGLGTKGRPVTYLMVGRLTGKKFTRCAYGRAL